MENISRRLEPVDRLLTPQRVSYAWLLGGTLWLAWLLSVLLGPGNFDLSHKPVGTDYIQFYAAGETLRSGQEAHLYDFSYQRQLETEIAQGEFEGYYAFLYPPFFAWLFVPLASLPYIWSFWLWSLLGVVSLWFSSQLLSTDHPRHKAAWALTFFPVFASISFGQNSLISLLLFSLVFRLWRRGAGFWAGLAASLLLFKPQSLFGLGFLWLLGWRKDWRSLLGLATGGSILAGLTFGLLPNASQDYLGVVRNILPSFTTWEGFPYHNAHMLRSFLVLLMPAHPALSEILTYVFITLGVVLLAWFCKNYRDQPDLLFAVMICLTIWSLPYVMVYDWVLLLIPAVLFWEHFPRLRRQLRALYAIIWLAILISGPLTFAQQAVLPVALQISVPVLTWVLIMGYQLLKDAPSKGKVSAG